ncbi:DUF2513 domain-containing protein [Nitrosomonas sp.]|uniref:DUF2513 domain-containing protein n=1 Tax=Nitrosomonas sp. TaxID=42353 RepID=UPI0037C80137
MDLVREILLEAITEPHVYTNGNPSSEEFSDEQVGYHVWLMKQVGLVHAIIPRNLTSESPYAILVSSPWDGHDFADAAADGKIWNKAREGRYANLPNPCAGIPLQGAMVHLLT